MLGEVDLAHQDRQQTDGSELPEFQAELEQPEEQNKYGVSSRSVREYLTLSLLIDYLMIHCHALSI
jgi:hypothetical protein